MCLRREVPRPARKRIEGPPKEGAELASIILTVPLPKDGNFKDKEREKLDYQSHIVGKCRAAGLEVRGFYGLQAPNGSQSVFLQVSASLERLLTEADRVKMPLQLDPWELESADETINRFIVDHVDPGFFSSADGGGDSEHLDVRIPAKPKSWQLLPCLSSTPLNAYDRIWAPFVSDSKLRRLYAVQEHTHCILTEVQALKLLRSIMEARADTDGGAGLDLDELQGKGNISRWFPGHSDRAKADLMKQWGGVRMPWNAPVGRVKEYMGEKVSERTSLREAGKEYMGEKVINYSLAANAAARSCKKSSLRTSFPPIPLFRSTTAPIHLLLACTTTLAPPVVTAGRLLLPLPRWVLLGACLGEKRPVAHPVPYLSLRGMMPEFVLSPLPPDGPPLFSNSPVSPSVLCRPRRQVAGAARPGGPGHFPGPDRPQQGAQHRVPASLWRAGGHLGECASHPVTLCFRRFALSFTHAWHLTALRLRPVHRR